MSRGGKIENILLYKRIPCLDQQEQFLSFTNDSFVVKLFKSFWLTFHGVPFEER